MKSSEFFRLLYAIAKIAFINARIIASLDLKQFISNFDSSFKVI